MACTCRRTSRLMIKTNIQFHSETWEIRKKIHLKTKLLYLSSRSSIIISNLCLTCLSVNVDCSVYRSLIKHSTIVLIRCTILFQTVFIIYTNVIVQADNNAFEIDRITSYNDALESAAKTKMHQQLLF